jgi:type II secretory pathway pseudopilin PulG
MSLQRRSRCGGFAYLFLLFALAVMGLLMSAFGENWTTTLQREREADLLFIGKQFGTALAGYSACAQGGATAPATLDELLEDKRFPFPVRHLRQIFRDPMTGNRDWDLKMANGRIIGVRSRSLKHPLRSKLPDYVVVESDAGTEVTYNDWLFLAPQNTRGEAAPKCVVSATP